mmetsp:Transcript_6387/g.7921  ORF Transcript_6387/g.7921 Transcript_6387/m.7921 type:complete len:243 (+) Transcript_6387:349-1077(+)
MVLRLRNYSIIHRTICLVCLQMLQIHHIKQLGSKIRRAGNEQRLLLVEGNPIDLLLMREEFFNLISILRIVQPNRPIVEGNEQRLIAVEPGNVGRLDQFPIGHFRQVNLQPRPTKVDLPKRRIVDGYLCIMINERVGDGGEHLATVCPGHAADWSVVDEGVQDLAGFAVPEVDRCVGTGSEEAGGETVGVEVPDGSFVAVEGADSFSVFGPPHGWDVVFGGCEEQVSVVVVFDDCYGSLVTF